MGRLAKVASGVAFAAVLLAGCSGGPTPPPSTADADDTSAGGPVDGCRPALAEDDSNPDADGVDQHPALAGAWTDDIVHAVMVEHTDVLANVWSDDEAGELVVMVPGPEGMRILERLRQEAPDPERVVCMEATYSHEELHLLWNRVDERLVDAGGPLPIDSTIDRMRNRVDVGFEFASDLAEAQEALGDLADEEGIHLIVAECAEVAPLPEGATALPGGGSNCQSMKALRRGVLAGDPMAGCAWIENDAGEPTTVVWPRGWSITDDGTVLDHRGEPRASIGDRVESVGGHGPLAEGQRACGLGGENGAWILGALDRAGDGAGAGTDEG